MAEEKIEILPVELLYRHRLQVEALRSLAHSLGIGLGWHYLLDLTWILENLGDIRGRCILDAGAGTGLLQWYLSKNGAGQIFSVDRGSRADLSLRFRARYPVRGLRREDLDAPPSIAAKNVRAASGAKKAVVALRAVAGVIGSALPKLGRGAVVIYNQDLASMPVVPDACVDAVVAVSALEHNTPDGLNKVVKELMRVLKPGGVLLATLCAGYGKDWFHEPSQGWCYTDKTLRRLFGLPKGTPSNYKQHDALFAALQDCAELRDNLADFYFRSGDNGMPWGEWDPQYQPVGVCKVKLQEKKHV